MNVFRALIASGKISTQTELRRYYRALAKQLHPDTSRPGSSDPAFVRLQQDYAEAQSQLHRNVQANPAYRPSRRALIECFCDLEASNFPVDIRVRNTIRGCGDDIVDNPLYQLLRMILANTASFHDHPTTYKKRNAEKWFAEIEKVLQQRGFLATEAFFRWLVEDLKNGSAFAPRV